MSDEQRQLEELKSLVQTRGKNALADAMQYLSQNRPDYYWVGIYKLEGDTLVLGPYVGPKTDHLRIPVGRGVCGTAVAEDRNQVVGDVRELDNYLACNLETRSEIVVLIREPGTGRILGQIDVDGRKVNAFGKKEEAFLTGVAELLAPHLA